MNYSLGPIAARETDRVHDARFRLSPRVKAAKAATLCDHPPTLLGEIRADFPDSPFETRLVEILTDRRAGLVKLLAA